MNKSRKGVMQNKQPEFFSQILHNMIFIINSVFGLYLIFSFILFFFYKIFGQDFMSNWEGIDIFINNNFYNITIIALFIIIGYISTFKKSLVLFSIYSFTLILMNLNYFVKILGSDANSTSNIISNTMSTLLNMIMFLSNFALSAYSVHFYFLTIGYFKYNLNDLPFSKVIHEIRLRTDMMKMNYNSFIINLKLNKFVPGILFKKEDYYFMSADYVESFPQVIEDNTVVDMKDKSYMRNQNNYSNDHMHSKSTIDSEYEPLR